MTPRQEATIKQLKAQIEKTDEEIMRLLNVKANLKSKINAIKQKDDK